MLSKKNNHQVNILNQPDKGIAFDEKNYIDDLLTNWNIKSII